MSITPVKSDQSFPSLLGGISGAKGLNQLELFSFFSVCFSLFIIFLAPSITSNDAGELGAAAFELGIAHPPGFPVFSILQNGLMQLLSVGEIAFRGNLSSALWAALALTLIFFTLRTRGVNRTEAWCCGLLAACAPLFTVHAVTIEVYAGAGCIIALAVELLLRYLERNDIRYLFTLGIIFGLGGLGHHPLLRLVGVTFAFFVLPKSGLKQGVSAFGVALAAGLLSLMYLPIRSSGLPNRDWGSPRTLNALKDHILGQRIQDSYGGDMWSWDSDLVVELFTQLFNSSPVLLLLGCVGLLTVRSVKFIRVYAALFALDLAYTIFINPMGVRDYQNGWLITLMLFALSSTFIAFLRHVSPRTYPALQVILSMVLLWHIVQYTVHEEFSQPNPWHESVTKMAQQLQPESLVFTASDSASSLFAFLQVAHAARPDLAVVVRQHVFRDSSTGPTFRRVHHALEGWKQGANLSSLSHLESEWPLVWEWAGGLNADVKPALTETMFPFLSRGQSSISGDLLHWQSQPPNPLWSQRPKFVQSIVLSQVAAASSMGGLGSIHLGKVLKWYPDNHLLWMRYAAQLTAEGQFEVAEEVVETVLRIFPNDLALSEQKMRILIAQNRFEEAASFGHTLRPETPELQANILGLLGVCSANLKAYRAAHDFFQQALSLDPQQTESLMYQPRIKSLLAHPPKN